MYRLREIFKCGLLTATLLVHGFGCHNNDPEDSHLHGSSGTKGSTAIFAESTQLELAGQQEPSIRSQLQILAEQIWQQLNPKGLCVEFDPTCDPGSGGMPYDPCDPFTDSPFTNEWPCSTRPIRISSGMHAFSIENHEDGVRIHDTKIIVNPDGLLSIEKSPHENAEKMITNSNSSNESLRALLVVDEVYERASTQAPKVSVITVTSEGSIP